MAIGGDKQSVERVGDEIVERVDCAVELRDSGVEGAKHDVEVVVEREQGTESIFDCLEEIESAVSEGYESSAIVQGFIVCSGIILTNLHVSHGKVTKGPA